MLFHLSHAADPDAVNINGEMRRTWQVILIRFFIEP